MAIEAMGYPVISLTGWQAGIHTNSTYGNARIKRIDHRAGPARSWTRSNIVIVAGFQGINQYDDITTLGRGGSDTTRRGAGRRAPRGPVPDLHRCGRRLHRRSPPWCQGARKLEEITYDEMLELATLGAQVLHNRSVEMAKRYQRQSGGPLQLCRQARHESQGGCKSHGKDPTSAAWPRITTWPGWPWWAWPTSPASPSGSSPCWPRSKINVDIILQSIGRNETKDISFTVRPGRRGARPRACWRSTRTALGFDHIDVERSDRQGVHRGRGHDRQPRRGRQDV